MWGSAGRFSHAFLSLVSFTSPFGQEGLGRRVRLLHIEVKEIFAVLKLQIKARKSPETSMQFTHMIFII